MCLRQNLNVSSHEKFVGTRALQKKALRKPPPWRVSVNCIARLIVLSLVALSPRVVRSQQSAQIDPVVVSPKRFKILLNNEHVRVVEYTLRPGERDGWHTHPPKFSYVVSGGQLRIHLADGTSFPSDEKEGTAVWMNTLPRHYAENVGTTPVRIVLVEVKSANDPSKKVRANTR